MNDFESAELAAIHAAFAADIIYRIGLTGQRETVAAVRSSVAAEDFMGPGRTLRTVRFEITFAAFETAFAGAVPVKGDRILEGVTDWRVNDVVSREDVLAWITTVERD